MPQVDFTTALGRLLKDGALRDKFANSPESIACRMEIRDDDRATLLTLNAEDLEYQAQVLLRKRLDLVRRMIPRTCRLLGDQLAPSFLKYARTVWPSESAMTIADAYGFCSRLREVSPECLSELEWNRLCFARTTGAFAVHVVRQDAICGGTRLQILIRWRAEGWKEFVLYLKF